MPQDLTKLAAESFGERGSRTIPAAAQQRGGGIEGILGLFSSAAGLIGNLLGSKGGSTQQVRSLSLEPDKEQLGAINKAAARQQSSDSLIDSLLSGE